MNLTELKSKSAAELLVIAQVLEIENISRTRKQDMIFNILKNQARKGEAIYGDGVLEMLPMALDFFELPKDHTYLDQMIFTCLRAKYAVSTYGQAIQFPVKLDIPKKVSAILLY